MARKNFIPFFRILALLIFLALNLTAEEASCRHAPKPWISVDALFETDPIPWGTKDTDDAAIWLRADAPEKSLILGTSKVKPVGDRKGGLGVYDLKGREQQFIPVGRLNNVDTTSLNHIHPLTSTRWAMATNRSGPGLDLFQGDSSFQIKKVATLPLLDGRSLNIEPYGLCIATRPSKVEVFVTTKSGVLYRYQFIDTPSPHIALMEEISLAQQVSAADDQLVHAIVEKAAKAEDELDELPEKLAERFALEGCSYHIHQDRLFVGMENLGIWSLDLGSEKSSSAHLFLKISGSWTDIDVWSQDQEIPRITDDIEGMEVFHHGEQDFLIFSNQGISEFSLVELSRGSFVGNFKVTWGNDAVTHTDGLTIMAQPLSPELPEGVLVVHDDQNTAPDGSVQNANYKIVSLKTLFQALSTP